MSCPWQWPPFANFSPLTNYYHTFLTPFLTALLNVQPGKSLLWITSTPGVSNHTDTICIFFAKVKSGTCSYLRSQTASMREWFWEFTTHWTTMSQDTAELTLLSPKALEHSAPILTLLTYTNKVDSTATIQTLWLNSDKLIWLTAG